MLTSETRVAAVIVVILCASLGAASGLESTLNISPFTYVTRLRSTQEQCPSSALICPGACENKPMPRCGNAAALADAKKEAANAKEEMAKAKKEAKREAVAAAEAKKEAAKAKEEMAKAKKEAAAALADAKKEAATAKGEMVKAKKEAAAALY